MLDQLSLTIEQLASETGGSYIDAIVEFAHRNHIQEFEEIVALLHPTLYEKLKVEFIEKNFFKDNKIDNSIKDFFC
jgi:hypothetical protein